MRHLTPITSRRPGSEAPHAWLSERKVEVNSEGGTMITDDHNPLEYLQIEKSEYYRDMLIERIGELILFH